MSGSRRVILLIGVLAVTVLLALIYSLGRWYETRGYREERQQMSEDFGKLPTVTYDGKTYVRRPEVTTVLFIGVDQRAEEETTGYRSGGQSDFMLLLALDHHKREIRQLQVERDSITDVPVVGVLGNDVGTRRMQICLSHAYGGSEQERCMHTVQALANLLGGEKAQHCLSIRLDAIGVLNDRLGGVTVTVPEDYSDLDPAMTQGAVLRLNARQAELLVRERMTVADGTNASRMLRQRAFMSAAIDRVRVRLREDSDVAGTLFDMLDEISDYTDLQRGQLINELNQVYRYDVLPVDTMAGEYKLGFDGFMEYHVDGESAAAWVLQTLYEPSKE